MKKILLLLLLITLSNLSHGQQNCNASYTNTVIPGTLIVSFSNTSFSLGPIVTNFWNFGDGSIDTAANPVHIYATPGTYVVCLTILSVNPQCSNTFCDTIIVPGFGTNCTANFFWGYMGGNTCQFTNSSSSNTTSWLWQFGDNTTSTSYSPSHTYPAPGQYTVCLIASDSIGNCADTLCMNIIIQGGGCIAQFTYQVDTNYNGTVYFQGLTNNQNIVSWLWDFGNSNTSTLQNPIFQFPLLGIPYVCLTITDNTGCSATYCDTLNIQPPANCQAYFTNTSSQNTISFYNSSTTAPGDSIISISWDLGDMTYSSLSNPVHTYQTPGTYLVCLTISTSGGCSSNFCNYISVQPNTPCQSFFTVSLLGGNTVHFNNLSQAPPNSNFYWTFGDNQASTSTNPTHTYNGIGPWVVCLNVSGPNCQSYWCDTINLSSLACQAYFTSVQDTGNPLLYNFYDFSTGPASSWYWEFGDGDTSTAQSPSHLYANTGSYNVCLTINTLNGCTDTYCWQVTAIQSSCNKPFTYIEDTITGEFAFIIDTMGCNALTATVWDFGDFQYSTSFAPKHTYADTGWYHVCLTQSYSNAIYTQCENVYAKILNTTNVFETTTVNDINAYPNPSSDGVFYIESAGFNNTKAEVEVFNEIGTKVWARQMTTKGSVLEINLNLISNGLYIIRITADRKLSMKRVHIMKTN